MHDGHHGTNEARRCTTRAADLDPTQHSQIMSSVARPRPGPAPPAEGGSGVAGAGSAGTTTSSSSSMMKPSDRPAPPAAITSTTAAIATAATAAPCESQSLPPSTALERLALHNSQTLQSQSGLVFVPASALRAASRTAAAAAAAAPARLPAPAVEPPPAAVAAQPPAPDIAQRPFDAVVRGHRLGDACGPYLMSALLQLPTPRRQEVLSSLQVGHVVHCPNEMGASGMAHTY